jgi:hypothetical protein
MWLGTKGSKDGENVLPEDDRGSVGWILFSTSVPALLIGGVIWVDGIMNESPRIVSEYRD